MEKESIYTYKYIIKTTITWKESIYTYIDVYVYVNI